MTSSLRGPVWVAFRNPTFGFRKWHPKVSDEVMRECFECIRHGLGYLLMRETTRSWSRMRCTGTDIPSRKRGSGVHQAAGCLPVLRRNTGISPSGWRPHGAAKIGVEYALNNGYDNVVGMQMGPKTARSSPILPILSRSSRHGWVRWSGCSACWCGP